MRREKLRRWDLSRQFQRPPLKCYQGNVEAVLDKRSFPNLNRRIVNHTGINLSACGRLDVVCDMPSSHLSAAKRLINACCGRLPSSPQHAFHRTLVCFTPRR